MNSEQVMHAMGIDDAYRIERVLVRSANGVTELVTMEGAGPFVRKKMPLQGANRSVWAALAGNECARLPQVAATYEMPDCFVAVYDYVPGETLEDVMVRAGSLDADRAIQIAADLCEALAALHARGVVHLDVAPANVIVAADGAHLVDFGNARMIADEGCGREAPRPKGTWGFAAPEQFFSHVDERFDVFAVGRLLGYMLTGTLPDEDRSSAFEGHLQDESVVSAPLRALIERATAFEPSARYQDAGELATALEVAVRAGKDAPGALAPASGVLAGKDDATAPGDALGADTQGDSHARGGSAGRSVNTVRIATLVLACVAALMGLVVAYKVFVKPPHASVSVDAVGDGRIPGAAQDDGGSRGAPTTAGGTVSQGDLQRAAESLRIVESGWRASTSGYVDYAVTIENTSSDLIIEFPEVSIVGRDAAGSVLFTSSQVMGIIYPGSTMTFACLTGNGIKPASAEFSMVEPKEYQVSLGTGTPTTYKVFDVAAHRDASGTVTVSGEVEMTVQGDESLAMGEVWLSALPRDASGAIITGAHELVASPKPGKRTPFLIEIDDCPEYATVEVAALVH